MEIWLIFVFYKFNWNHEGKGALVQLLLILTCIYITMYLKELFKDL